MSIVIVGAGPNLGAAVARRFGRGEDHEPDEVAEVLWRHHTDRGEFQIKLGFD